ncbi:hypothetical protein [Citrobacter braakii]|nr:hypothetical protein [Citrobacter braakii]
MRCREVLRGWTVNSNNIKSSRAQNKRNTVR